MFQSGTKRGSNRGFTLIELLAVLAVIGLLVALLLPAIQSARESARRTACASNLAQLGIAFANYESSVGAFPPCINANRGYSAFSMVLSQFEQGPLYNAINYQNENHDPSNLTASSTVLRTLLCPSTPEGYYLGGGTNYAGSVGYGYQLQEPHEGIFGEKPIVATTTASITDGLSNTALVGEWITGSIEKKINNVLGNAYFLEPGMLSAGQFETFNQICVDYTPVSDKIYNSKGNTWLQGGLGSNLYNHNLTPNHNSCLNGSMLSEGCWTLSSYHPGGVNVLVADGHVRFVKNAIALPIWRGFGTKSGGDPSNIDE